MKAMQLVEYGQPLKLVDLPIPRITRHDALVRIKACGVCHTDLHLQEGSIVRGRLPFTLGHEMAGEVAEMGEETDWLRKGMRVLVNYHYACGVCHNCRVGLEEECTELTSGGMDVDGGYAEYVKVPAKNLLTLPQEVSHEEASVLACGGGTVYHAIKVNPINIGETIVIYGFGGLGTIALQVAKLVGANTLVIDISDEKLALAQKLGADHILNPSRQDVVKETKALTRGEGPQKVFDLVSAPATLETSLQLLHRKGRLIVIGALTKPFQVNPLHLVRSRIQIHGQGGCPSYELEELIQLVKQRRVQPFISKEYPLKDLNQALEDLRGGRILGRAVAKP